MKKLKEDKYSYSLIIFSICTVVLLLLIGTSIAVFSKSMSGSTNTINTATVSFLYTEPSNDITLETSSSSDSTIITESTNYMDFTVSGTSNAGANLAYYIYFNENSGNTVTKDSVKFYLSSVSDSTETSVTGIKQGSSIVPFNISTLTKDTSSSNYLLYSSTMSFSDSGGTITKKYRLRFWISSAGTEGNVTYSDNGKAHTAQMTGSYSIKLNVYAVLGTAVTIS